MCSPVLVTRWGRRTSPFYGVFTEIQRSATLTKINMPVVDTSILSLTIADPFNRRYMCIHKSVILAESITYGTSSHGGDAFSDRK